MCDNDLHKELCPDCKEDSKWDYVVDIFEKGAFAVIIGVLVLAVLVDAGCVGSWS